MYAFIISVSLSVAGVSAPVSSASLSAFAGYKAFGILYWASFWALFFKVLGNVVEASAFTWPKNDSCSNESHPDWICYDVVK